MLYEYINDTQIYCSFKFGNLSYSCYKINLDFYFTIFDTPITIDHDVAKTKVLIYGNISNKNSKVNFGR